MVNKQLSHLCSFLVCNYHFFLVFLRIHMQNTAAQQLWLLLFGIVGKDLYFCLWNIVIFGNLKVLSKQQLSWLAFRYFCLVYFISFALNGHLDVSSLLFQGSHVCLICIFLPTMEDIVRTWSTLGPALIGTYLFLVLILAERNPDFCFLSVKTYQLAYAY